MKPHDPHLNAPHPVIDGLTLSTTDGQHIDTDLSTRALAMLTDFIKHHDSFSGEVTLRMCIPERPHSSGRHSFIILRISVTAGLPLPEVTHYHRETIYRMESEPAIWISHGPDGWTRNSRTGRWRRQSPVTLTAPERETLEMAREHLTVREMAEISFRSVNTIKSRVARLLSRLGVHSLREALFLCRLQGAIGDSTVSIPFRGLNQFPSQLLKNYNQKL